MILDREARSYTRQLANMDHIFTNSQNVHDRLLAYCGYESEILYPPTDVSRFMADQETPPKNYFLSFARLSPPKRVDLIIDAFLQMPDQYLILTYGRNDPMRDDILARIS